MMKTLGLPIFVFLLASLPASAVQGRLVEPTSANDVALVIVATLLFLAASYLLTKQRRRLSR